MNVLPGGGNIWSEFGQDFQSLLYNERTNYPNDISKEYNIHFLQSNKAEYSLGGTNNLNVSWSDDEWLKYFETHKGNYQELNLNLDL